jgi:hypothetical protein
MHSNSGEYSAEYVQPAFQPSRFSLTLVGMSAVAVTTGNCAIIANSIDLVPRFSSARDDHHLWGTRHDARGSLELLMRLFAVEDPSKRSFKSGWIGITPGGYVGQRNLAEQCLSSFCEGGYQLALIVGRVGDIFESFCKEQVQIGFGHRDGVLHTAVRLGSKLSGVAEFNAHGFAGGGRALATQDRPQAQGFMLTLVDALTGYVSAARFIRMPRGFMRGLHRSIEHHVMMAPATALPRSKYCGAFLTSVQLAEAIDDNEMVAGENCPVASLWIPAGTEITS